MVCNCNTKASIERQTLYPNGRITRSNVEHPATSHNQTGQFRLATKIDGFTRRRAIGERARLV